MLRACCRFVGVVGVCLAVIASPGNAATRTDVGAESRLLHIYDLIGQSRSREALQLADKLALDFPNFRLAQLVRGDLLLAHFFKAITLRFFHDHG